ncbi:MAG: carbon-nitrogen family hydrolase [Alphaproteobacteria bacterium]|nr:carbon-nitrogen family hydrolase [Alphaproteobacteria bacterium]
MNVEVYLTLVQKKIGYKSIIESISYLNSLANSAPSNKINLFLLPELWLSGFDRQKLFFFADQSEELISNLQIFCKSRKINFCGTISEFSDHSKKLYNSQIFITDTGKILSRYKKIHLFPLTSEREVFLDGNSPIIVNFHGIKIGFAICYDIRFPELFRYYAQNGVELVLISACFPTPRLRDWKILLQARALENQFYVAAVNAVGSERINDQKLTYFGHSLLASPKGEIIDELDGKEGTKTTVINIKDVKKARDTINYLNDIKNVYQKMSFDK